MELRNEDRLLLDCLKGNGEQLRDSGLERLTASDLDGVLQQSIRHSVAPLVYKQLWDLDLHLPAGFLERLRDMYVGIVVKNMILYHELSKRLKILREQGIPVILLKGGYLGECVYGDIGLRCMKDVDLLLRKEDLARGQRSLLDAGYPLSSSELSLDFHTAIHPVDSARVDIEMLWERAVPVVIDGEEVLALSPEDLLLHLCLHLSLRHLYRLAAMRALWDIRETIEHYESQMNWKKIQHRAIQWGAANCVYLTLFLAKELLDAAVPDSILGGLRPKSFDPQMITWALEQIFHSDATTPDLSSYFWQLWKAGPLREKASNLRKLLFPSAEDVSVRYHAPLGSVRNYLCYLSRLRDHLPRYTLATWRSLIRHEEMAALIESQNRNLAMGKWLASNQ